MNIESYRKKYELVKSETYKKIRAFELDKIVELANSNIEPLILKGMLKTIYDIDNWEKEYNRKLKENNKE